MLITHFCLWYEGATVLVHEVEAEGAVGVVGVVVELVVDEVVVTIVIVVLLAWWKTLVVGEETFGGHISQFWWLWWYSLFFFIKWSNLINVFLFNFVMPVFLDHVNKINALIEANFQNYVFQAYVALRLIMLLHL